MWAGTSSTGKVFDYGLTAGEATLYGTDIAPMYPGFSFNRTSGDYIDTNNSFESVFQSDFSITFWCKPNDGRPAVIEYFMGIDEDLPGVPVFSFLIWYLATGKIRMEYGVVEDEESVVTSSIVFANGQENWHLIVITVEQVGSKVRLTIYFDGAQVGQATSTDDVDMSNAAPNLNLIFGGKNYSERLPTEVPDYNGLLDDVMIFNKVKTAEEIRSIYELTRWRYQV